MELDIRGKNIEITPDVEKYILRKMVKVVRHLNNLISGKVEIAKTQTRSQQDRIVVQVTLNANGTLLRGQERGPNVFLVVDAVADVMDRQAQRYKGKLYRGEMTKKAGRGVSIRDLEAISAGEPKEEEPFEGAFQVTRVKRFIMKPMTVDEAINQMELLGHSFFLFLNSASNEYNVVYTRQGGGYGLIEAEAP